jgi:hypothetical protein
VITKDRKLWCSNGVSPADFPYERFHVDFEKVQSMSSVVGWTGGCGLTRDKGVACWGESPEDLDVPVEIQGKATDLVTSSSGLSCALSTDDKVYCWGSGMPDTVFDSPGAKTIVMGNGHVCSLSTTGKVRCWGLPGQQVDSKVLDVPASLPAAQSLSAAGSGTCALLMNGSVRCWGYWFSGGTPIDSPADLADAQSVTTAEQYACAITAGRNVTCWGYINLPQGLPKLKDVRKIALNSIGVCAVMGAGGTVACEGYSSSEPVYARLKGIQALKAGKNHVCAQDKDGILTCWGDPEREVPANLGKVRSFGTNQYQTCAITQSNSLQCWGGGIYAPQVKEDGWYERTLRVPPWQ